ncbi:uncharacterized protein BDCG_07308 [Blastomyces dermatitidis ER-3]|uniref:Uncharacterized protein n=1 Tax=Ajellomyces dermatitidis (strain ER-3 / ATCC MYA-2586) TaxID=559297 RepID=A0ABM9YIU2_AJEDR|nr:uncharacterized protein BDCG_07308 [Blastomyces dermatitidis ER-3]EEQ92188.1 hypothetical protein BDCG_07308 [Blastomyces dermatitidis ER-3]
MLSLVPTPPTPPQTLNEGILLDTYWIWKDWKDGPALELDGRKWTIQRRQHDKAEHILKYVDTDTGDICRYSYLGYIFVTSSVGGLSLKDWAEKGYRETYLARQSEQKPTNGTNIFG